MFNNIIVRLAAYYLGLLAVLTGAFQFLPQMRKYVSQQRDRFFMEPLTGSLTDAGSEFAALLDDMKEELTRVVDLDGVNLLIDPSITIPVTMALILAFAVALPITWVYQWTHPKKRHNKSFIHVLLVTPIAIALVVFLVKGSLALAFGLAGIVAAVRFRATIKDPMDAVYMLMAIAIGLAAGVQLTTVAYVSSVMFVVITLFMWKSDYGGKAVEVSGWSIVSPDAPAEVSKAPHGT